MSKPFQSLFVSWSFSSGVRMWKRPSWKQQRGFTKTFKMEVWTWTLLSQESSTNRLRRREAASTPTASRPKKAAAANPRQNLQTHQMDGWTDRDRQIHTRRSPLHQAPTCVFYPEYVRQDWAGLYLTFNSSCPTTYCRTQTPIQSPKQDSTFLHPNKHLAALVKSGPLCATSGSVSNLDQYWTTSKSGPS